MHTLLFTPQELEGHAIPKEYGAIRPTAVYVPLDEMLKNDVIFNLATTEIFGPLQVVTSFGSGEEDT